MDASLRIAVVGQRPKDMPEFSANAWLWMREQLHAVVRDAMAAGPCTFLTGLDAGAEMDLADAVRREAGDFEVYLPFPQAPQRNSDQRLFRRLKALATNVVVVSDRASRQAFLDRNRALVEDCHVLVAAWDGRPSGTTWAAVRLAVESGHPVLWVDPIREIRTVIGAAPSSA